jgi:glutathione S-transferase
LARKFDLYGKLTSSINDKDLLQGYIDGVVSCAYTDIITNIITTIWNNVDFTDETTPLGRLGKKIPNDLKALNNLLKKSSTSFYYDQTEPTIADYFVFEAFTLTRDVYKNLIPNGEDCQALIKHEQIMKERPGLANYFNKGLLFKRITGSPKENEYMAKLAETQK